jgi:hypothetical protein
VVVSQKHLRENPPICGDAKVKVGTMIWHKSSHSAALNCVEVGIGLEKSSHSESGACVEAGPCACGGDVLVRDTKDREGGTLAFSREAWAAFLADVRAGGLTGP